MAHGDMARFLDNSKMNEMSLMKNLSSLSSCTNSAIVSDYYLKWKKNYFNLNNFVVHTCIYEYIFSQTCQWQGQVIYFQLFSFVARSVFNSVLVVVVVVVVRRIVKRVWLGFEQILMKHMRRRQHIACWVTWCEWKFHFSFIYQFFCSLSLVLLVKISLFIFLSKMVCFKL